jgi:HemY protein
MARLIGYFLALAAGTAGLAWLADRPGTLTVDWMGYEGRLSVFQAVVLMLLALAALWLLTSLLRSLLRSPQSVTRFFHRRRQQQGLDALTSGMIAIGAGDRMLAARYATQASRMLPNEPLTDLLRAQTAQLAGDRKTAQRVYEQMLLTPQTELLGLRGLYLEAERGGDLVAARGLAEQALKRGPKLAWASDALFDMQCRQSDWAGAIVTLAAARRNELVSRKDAERRRAVLLTAQAMDLEDKDPGKAETFACEAHELAPELVPAAEIAGRLLAARGKMQKSTATLEQTWKRAPHPELALIHAHARTGDSPRDRLQRIRKLAALTPGNREGNIAIANAAIESRSWAEARAALEPLLSDGLSARICVLMARIEGGDSGRVREWLARAIHAPRDPVWVADSHVSDRWAPVSPVTGRLDAYEWKVAEETTENLRGALLLEELAEFATPESGGLTDRSGSSGRPRTIEAEPAAVTARKPAASSDGEGVAGSSDPVSLAAKRALRSADRTIEPARPSSAATDVSLSETTVARADALSKPAGTAPGARDADVEFFVPSRAPDDPGTEGASTSRKAAS